MSNYFSFSINGDQYQGPKAGLLLNDIRFWVLLFFLLRLYGITQPPLEIAHNWRQTTVTMVARNFLETDANILHPRIDIGGPLTGITGMEFPLFNWLIYMVSLIFGYDHWYGRLINLIVSSLGVWAFYDIVRRLRNKKLALNAGLILLSSLWFTYSRKIMPDTFSVALAMIGMQQAVVYLQKGAGRWRLVLFFIFTTFGLLSKLPSMVAMALLPLLLLGKHFDTKQRFLLAIVSVLAVVPSVWWYFFYVPYLNQAFGLAHFFMGKPMAVAARELIVQWQPAMVQLYETAIRYSGFTFFVAGFFIAFWKDKRLSMFAIASLMIFLVFVLKAGDNFVRHSYYMIPVIPAMSVMAAYALSFIPVKKLSYVVLALILLEGLLNQQHDFRIKEKDLPMLRLETILNELSSADELIAINSGEYPTPMYFAHRKGWVCSNQMLLDTAYVSALESNGLQTIVILKRSFGSDLILPYAEAYNDADFRIYRP